jgi:hypothetical protein
MHTNGSMNCSCHYLVSHHDTYIELEIVEVVELDS